MPACSVVTTVYNPSPEHLRACLESVRSQTFDDIEHVVVDDCSTEPHVGEVLDAASADDARLRVIRRTTNGGIVAASNDAIEAAAGDFIALLDHDDVLEPHAVASMIGAIGAADADVAYSDHDLLMPSGRRCTPTYKPDFSPEHLRNQNYILHLVVARRELVIDVGGFRPGFDGAQDHDLLLRLSERTDRFVHVPEVLYHWRLSEQSVATDAENKPWAFDAGRRAVQDHCDRMGIDARVSDGVVAGSYRLERRRRNQARVSVVIPTRGGSRRVWGVERCFVVEAVQSLVEHSTTDDVEYVVVYDDVTPAPVLHALERIAGERLVLVEYSATFNFSEKINLGVRASSGPLLLILNDDTELIEPSSIEVLAAHLDDPGVGMVGPKLLFADGTIQDGGHVYNRHLLPGIVGWHGDSAGPGQLRPLAIEREVSGVTAAAAMITRSVFDELGGYDESIPVSFNDVDLCLRLRATGRRIIWTPQASWYHFESQTRPPTAAPEEFESMDARWHREINNDPYYNPNLAPYRSDWMERPFRSGEPVHEPETTAKQWLVQRITGKGARADGSLTNRLRFLRVAALFALALALFAPASRSGAGVVARMAFTGGPAILAVIAVAVAMYRQRWVLAAGLVCAFPPFALVVLVQGTPLSALFGVAVFTGVVIGPIGQAGRGAALAALGCAFAAWLAVWVLSAQPDLASVGQPAIVLWLLGAAIVTGGVVIGRRSKMLVAPLAALGVLTLLTALRSGADGWLDVGGFAIVSAAIIFATSRVELDPILGRRIFVAAVAAVTLSWFVAAFVSSSAADATPSEQAGFDPSGATQALPAACGSVCSFQQ